MRPQPSKTRFFGQARKRAILFCLVLALSMLIAMPQITRVHGASPLQIINSLTDSTCVAVCHLGAFNVQNGDFFIVQDDLDNCGSAGITSTPSETWTQVQGVGDYAILTATAHSTATYTITCSAGPGASFGPFIGVQFRGTFNGFGSALLNQPGSSQTGSDTITLTVQAGSIMFEGFVAFNSNQNPSNCPVITPNSGQTSRGNTCVAGTNSVAGASFTSGPTVGAGSLPLMVSWATCTGGNGVGCGTLRHSVVEITSVVPSGTIGTTTACYGNCGNPPITLVNANATHLVPFNQSLTLFYQFQAQGNGFLQNITVNLAKSYINGQRVTVGVYSTSSSCPSTVTPFSIQCPAILIQSLSGPINPSKGRFSLSGLQIQFQSGQVGGLAVSGLFTGLDLNQTNAACGVAGAGFCASPPGMLQTPGVMPSTITTYSTPSQASISSTGLWGFIVSAISPSQGPPGITGPCNGNFAQLDCLLPNLVNSFCNTVTMACQTGSSFLWITVLTLITFASLMVVLSTLFPNLNPRGFFVGEFLIMIFIGWFVTFAGLGLLPSFMIVLFFFIISWLFIGKVKGTGPI